MKRIKSIFSFALAVLLFVFSVSVPAGASAFPDVYSTTTYLDAINYVSDNGIMVGEEGGYFNPNNSLTRAMCVMVLYKMAGQPYAYSGQSFSDVPTTAWYYDAVQWAVSEGITSGTGDGKFEPNKSVIRQDAMRFFYLYATKVANVQISRSANITGYSDYSSVSSYAQSAVAWAMGNKMLKLISGNLAPKATIKRSELAYAVTGFGSNVQRIVLGSDNLGFVNSGSNFTLDRYYLTAGHYSKLKSAYTQWGGSSGSSGLLDRLNKGWTGSCYGMSTVVALDKLGKIAYNENYSSSNNMMHDIKSIKGDRAESAINYYQNAYSLLGCGSGRSNLSTDIPKAMNVCKNATGPSMLSYYWKEKNNAGQTVTKGHTILVNSCTQSGSTYNLSVCNPNYISTDSTFTTASLTTSGTLKTASRTWQLTEIEATSNFSTLIYESMDIDGYQNRDTTSSNSATYKVSPRFSVDESSNGLIYTSSLGKDFSTLSINLVGKFVVSNEDGKSLKWTGDELTGDMEIYNLRLIPNGEEHAATLEIDVPQSLVFTFKSSVESDENWFSVADSYRYARVSGRSLGLVTMKGKDTITLDGESLEFKMAYSAVGDEYPLLTTSAKGSNQVIMERDNNSISLKGTDSSYTVTVMDLDRSEMDTIQQPVVAIE